MGTFIIIWIICGIVAAMIGSNKGSTLTGFFAGFLLGPLGILYVIFMKGDRKQCPFCREYIHENATKCPHCQSDLTSIQAETKKCPVCSERVKLDAIGCKFCGYNFMMKCDEARLKELKKDLETKLQDYESQEGAQGEAFCIGCRTTGPQSDMLFNKKLNVFYHRGCIPKVTGPSSGTPDLKPYHQDNVKKNEDILETNLSSPASSAHSTSQKTLPERSPISLQFLILGIIVVFIMMVIFLSNHKSPQQESTNQKSTNQEETTTPSTTDQETASSYWVVSNYVDEFKRPLNYQFITNREKISGTFSNTATQDSPLNVSFIVTRTEVWIQLYEYAKDVPVKYSYQRWYKISTSHGRFHARSETDRIYLLDGIKLNRLLVNSEVIMFHIVEEGNPTTVYDFSVKGGEDFKKTFYTLYSERALDPE